MDRKLRYSERKRLAKTGSLGPLSDSPTDELRNVIVHVYVESTKTNVGPRFHEDVRNACIEYFGWSYEQAGAITSEIRRMDDQDLLDFLEIVVDEGSAPRGLSLLHGGPGQTESAMEDMDARFNEAFERHRFGYRFEDGEIRKIGSPALDEEVIGPALLALTRPGYQEAERSFREALRHQRSGSDENDDALTAANAALEAAMKAAGFEGANLGPLSKSFKKSAYVPSELRGAPEALNTLIGRSGALRSSFGDSHGKPAGAKPVPQPLVDLAIYWAGAFIVYLAESTPATGG